MRKLLIFMACLIALSLTSCQSDAQKLVERWGISESKGGEYLQLPHILVNRDGAINVFEQPDRPLYQYSAGRSEYQAGERVGNPRGTILYDINSDGKFDAKIDLDKTPHGLQIWYDNAWLLTNGSLDGVKDQHGYSYKFDVKQGVWARD